MNKEIKKILSDELTIGNQKIPIAHLRYNGDSLTFVTWTIVEEKPLLSANDDDLYSIVQIDVDIYSDGNYVNIVNKIKKLFKESDWVWIEDSVEMYEEDTKLYHKTVTFEKEKEINYG